MMSKTISIRFDKDPELGKALLEQARARSKPIDGCNGGLICRHDEVCSRCGNPHCIKYMRHTRLYGYQCHCGSSEWREQKG